MTDGWKVRRSTVIANEREATQLMVEERVRWLRRALPRSASWVASCSSLLNDDEKLFPSLLKIALSSTGFPFLDAAAQLGETHLRNPHQPEAP